MTRWASAALAFVLGVGTAVAQTPATAVEPPAAADLLFEMPQLTGVPPGTALNYRYRRSGGGPDQLFGPPIEDQIRLDVEAGTNTGERTVRVQMFTGERHRAAGPFENTRTNPVLLLFLEHELGDLSRLLGANPRYLKNAIRAGLRDHAIVRREPVQIDGRSRPGWLVEVQPFLDDPKKERMKGLHTLRLRFQTAEAVPGGIASILAEADGPEGKLIEESLTYESAR